jgi:hypothetical protein
MAGSFPGGPLDLSNADTSGFAPIDAGRYNATIHEIKMDAVKNTDGTGKLPAGTPMMKVQFKVLNPVLDGKEIEQDRRVFTQFVIPPKDYDKKKASTMQGMLASFFIASGDDEAKVKSPKFNPDFEDYIGREVVVIISKEEYPKGSGEFQNRVKGVKKAGTLVGSSSPGLL